MSLQLGVLAMEQTLSAPKAMLAAIQAVGSQLLRQHYPCLSLKHVKHGNIRPLCFMRTTHSPASNIQATTSGIAAQKAGHRDRAIILTRRSFGVTESITFGLNPELPDQILAR